MFYSFKSIVKIKNRIKFKLFGGEIKQINEVVNKMTPGDTLKVSYFIRDLINRDVVYCKVNVEIEWFETPKIIKEEDQV